MESQVYPVDVISLCSAEGEIVPLRLRVETESLELQRADIEEVISTKQVPYVGAESYVFLCRIRSGQLRCTVELKYAIRSHTWWLLRILC